MLYPYRFRYKLGICKPQRRKSRTKDTEAGKAIGCALEQPLHVVALPCSALRILKRLQQDFRKTTFVRLRRLCGDKNFGIFLNDGDVLSSSNLRLLKNLY
jgi:hypothetical protein